MPDTREPLEAKLPKTASKDQLDFLTKCLDKDPSKRLTCDQLLKHSYFSGFSFRLPTSDAADFERLKEMRGRSTAGGGGGSYSNPLFPSLPPTGNGSPPETHHKFIALPGGQQQSSSFDHLPTI